MRIGVLFSRLRVDEKLIFEALERRGVAYDRIDDRETAFDLSERTLQHDLVLVRSISQSRCLYASAILNNLGVPTVNSHQVIANCADKVVTSALLARAGLAVPRTVVALTPQAALCAIESMGYPVVLKPVVGSWGRCVSKINDREAAEAVLEHKAQIGSSQHAICYIQEYVQKPGRDIRVVVIGDKPVAAMYRCSSHWITNAARGSSNSRCEITTEIGDTAVAAASSVGGGAVAVDLLESPRGLLVNEVNGTMEFKACTEATGVDIAGCVVAYALSQL